MRVGYVVKRFPRTSETFIAREVLELERLGAEVQVTALRPNDSVQHHAWLDSLAAKVTVCAAPPLSEAWSAIEGRTRAGHGRLNAPRNALLYAAEMPDGRGKRYLRDAVFVAREAERAGVDHLHAHFANRPAIVAMLAHLISGIPFSFTAHAKDIYAAPPPLRIWRRLLRLASFAVTVNEANRRYLSESLGPRAGARIRVLHNGVDLRELSFAEPAPSSDGPSVVAVARLVEKKGLDVFIDALARLRSKGLDLHGVIVGDGPLRDELQARAGRIGAGRSIRFAGELPHQEVVRELRAARALALPCRVARDGDRDALPTVLLEALALGLPCVSTPIGGIPEIIRSEETGLLVEPEDAEGLAAALERLLTEDGLRRRIAAAGRRRAEDHFDARRNVERLHQWMGAVSGSRPESLGREACAAG